MASIKSGKSFAKTTFGKLLVPWISGHMSSIFSGAAATQPVSMALLRILVNHGLQDIDPQHYVVD